MKIYIEKNKKILYLKPDYISINSPDIAEKEIDTFKDVFSVSGNFESNSKTVIVELVGKKYSGYMRFEEFLKIAAEGVNTKKITGTFSIIYTGGTYSLRRESNV